MLHKDGEFLVRNTELVQGTAVRQMCLSVKALGTVRHFPLQANEAGLYTIDGQPQFPTMLGLINHYYTTRTPFTKNKVKLLSPVVRHDWELLHHQVQLRRKIGEGAFGAVFAGLLSIKPTDKPRPVAVKTCQVNMSGRSDVMSKLLMLFQTLSGMKKTYGKSLDSGVVALLKAAHSLNLNHRVSALQVSCAVMLVDNAIDILKTPPDDGLGLRREKLETDVKKEFRLFIKEKIAESLRQCWTRTSFFPICSRRSSD
uniref:SH2 domain-containing protein n=1 Tax=Ditylenchus dipsaci TaxID=166011 RepID=A0A915EQK4_9BILA